MQAKQKGTQDVVISIGHTDGKYKRNKIEIKKKEFTREKDIKWTFNLHTLRDLRRKTKNKKKL